jgi:hypothetical protein
MTDDRNAEIIARNQAARDIVAGFASATPTLAVAWRTVAAALADLDALAADAARLAAELAAARMDRANLLAAMRATIAAHADGEADPLYYLRDELNARQGRAAGRGGAS